MTVYANVVNRLIIIRKNFEFDPEFEQEPVRPLEDRHNVVWLVRPAPAKKNCWKGKQSYTILYQASGWRCGNSRGVIPCATSW